MDPNINGEEGERLEREARKAVERARLDGERIRREAERKAKEDEDRGSNNEEEKEEELTSGFPIYDIPEAFGKEVKMKNIPPSILPNFYGTSIEVPDAFLSTSLLSISPSNLDFSNSSLASLSNLSLISSLLFGSISFSQTTKNSLFHARDSIRSLID